MSPKSPSIVWPLRRPTRHIARKSIPKSSSSFPIISSPPSATTAAVDPPPSAVIFPAPSPKEVLLDLSNSKDTPQSISNSTIGLSSSQSPNSDKSQKTLATDLGLMESDIGRMKVNDNVDSAVKKLGPEKTIREEDGTVEDVKDVSSIGGLPEIKSVEIEVSGSGNGKRKIVRKTVRVVKKIIKRRVPKRNLMNSLENEGLIEKVENSVDLKELTESLDMANNVIEKPNPGHDEVREISKLSDEVIESSKVVDGVVGKSDVVAGVTEKCSHVNDVMDESNIVQQEGSFLNEVIGKPNVVDEVMETSRHYDSGPFVSGPIASEKSNDSTDFDSVEAEAPRTNNSQCVLELMNDDKGNDQNGMCSLEVHETNINNVITGESMKDVNVGIPGSMEDEKVNYAAESTTQNQGSKEEVDFVMESILKESVLVNQNEDEAEVATDQNVGPVEENSVVLVEEKNGSDNGGLEKDSVGLNEGLLLSGEMEALERKKRRKIEIFVGGLDKDTKEEEIRRVFEKAGAVVDVNLVMKNNNTGKNKGFAFVRFATAADAKNALINPKVEICGKQCDVSPVEGNDTIFLGNIDRKWKTEDVMQLLEKCGIDKIDKVTLKADPSNIDKNRGFAFVELETNRVAQVAFNKLQKSFFVKNTKIRVAWAQPLIEPAEEEILKVKSVYAEYLPSSWDEEKVKEYFKRFGEIENVTLAKDLPLSRRKDFAFINYMTREAALACIESMNRNTLDDGSKVKMTVSLANPFSKIKPIKHASDLTIKELPKEKPKTSYATIKLHEPRYKETPVISSTYVHAKFDRRPSDTSTTNELVQILRQQASNSHIAPRQSIGSSIPENHFPPQGIKRPFSLVGHNPLHLEPRGLPRGRFESSSALSHAASIESLPYNHHHQQQQPRPGLPFESVSGRNIYPSHLQTREQHPYYGSNNIYRRY